MYAFVYGSLKKGYWNNRFLKKSTYCGKANLKGYSLYNVSVFPGMVKSKNDDEIVHGEVYKIDNKTLQILDELENEGEMYKRVELPVQLKNGEAVNAQSYLWLLELAQNTPKVIDNNWQKKLYCYHTGLSENMQLSIGIDFNIDNIDSLNPQMQEYTHIPYQISEGQSNKYHIRTPFLDRYTENWMDIENLWQILDKNGAKPSPDGSSVIRILYNCNEDTKISEQFNILCEQFKEQLNVSNDNAQRKEPIKISSTQFENKELLEITLPISKLDLGTLQINTMIFTRLAELSQLLANYPTYSERLIQLYSESDTPQKKLLTFINLISKDTKDESIFTKYYDSELIEKER